MGIKVNGNKLTVPDHLTVEGLIDYLDEINFDPMTLDDVYIVTVNNEYIPKDRFKCVDIREGDDVVVFPLGTGG